MHKSSNGFGIRGLVLAGLVFLGIAATTPALAIPPSEQKALEDLFNSTGGDGWFNNTNWLVKDPCNWFGVTCADIDNDSHVIAIELPGNSLINDLAANPLCPNPDVKTNSCFLPDLGALRYLRVFDVGFGGPIPNQLMGRLPDISKLSFLETFAAGGNRFSGALPDISKLSSLTFFDVSGNQLSGPLDLQSFKGLSQLAYFDVGRNELSGSLPCLSIALPCDSGLTLLEIFYADHNFFSGTLPDMGELPVLMFFEVSHNSLTGPLPDNLEKLSSLEYFNVAENQLSGPLPAPPSALIKRHQAYICPNHFDIVKDGSQFWQNLAWTIATGGDRMNPPRPWWNARSGDGGGWPACTPN